MEIIIILLLLIIIYVCLTLDKINKKYENIEKRLKKIEKEIKKIKTNEFYLFDYLEGIYEEIERGEINGK